MSNLERKRKKIFNLSLSSIILLVIGLTLLIIVNILLFDKIFKTNNTNGIIEFIIVAIILFILLLIGGILGLISEILTLSFPKTNSDLDEKRIIFGLLGLLLLGPIMSLTFSIIAKKYVNDANENY